MIQMNIFLRNSTKFSLYYYSIFLWNKKMNFLE